MTPLTAFYRAGLALAAVILIRALVNLAGGYA
jgi:hypothetical protein